MAITRRTLLKYLAFVLPASMVPFAPMGKQASAPQPEFNGDLKPYPMYTSFRKVNFNSKNYGIVAIHAGSQRELNRRASKILDIIAKKA
jgi:hypothetical protein